MHKLARMTSQAKGPSDYLEANKKSWNQCAAQHAASSHYNVALFKSDSRYISDVIKFDIPRLPSLDKLHVAHLMCHIGTDTLSLARLGAASVTGLDFSSASLDEARALADATQGSGGERLAYVEGDVYDSVELLGSQKFDMVFTSIGVICWIPRMKDWAEAIAGILKPGGKFFFRDHHPVFFTIEDKLDENNPSEQLLISYPYFQQSEGMRFDSGITYVDASTGGNKEAAQSAAAELAPIYEFSHGMGEIIQALIDAGLRITRLEEHDSVPWHALPGRMEPAGLQEWRLKHKPERVPFSFTIQAVKE